jgi:hypothetical protein
MPIEVIFLGFIFFAKRKPDFSKSFIGRTNSLKFSLTVNSEA